MYRKHLLPLMIVMLVVVLALSACGRAAGPDPTPAPTPTPSPTPTPTPPPVDEGPFRVVVAQPSGAVSWDPPQDWSTAPEWTIENAYDYLFTRSADGSEWIPELAYEWEIIDDVTIRFWIHDNVTFHDGTPLTAEDIKFHYERIIEGPRELYIVTNQYHWIEAINIIDDHTFDVVSVKPDSLFLWKLAQTNTGAGIVSKGYVERVGPEGVHREPMGTGPWRLVDWARDEYVLFERNEDYWRDGANFEEFEFRVIPEASTRVAELLTGGVDLIYGIMPQDEARVSGNPDISTLWAKSDRGFSLTIRTGVHPDFVGESELDRTFTTEDPRVREAIELALDKYALRDLIGGDGEPYRARSFGPLAEAPPELYGPEANLYDPDRASDLLTEAGYGPGEATLVFHAVEAYPSGDLARVITDMLETVGFNVDLRLMDQSSFNSDVYFPRRTQELMLLDLGGNMNPNFMTLGYTSDRSFEYGPINDEYHARVDELLGIAWTELQDTSRRIEAFHGAFREIAEARARGIGLFQISNLWGISNRIQYTPRFDSNINGLDIVAVR